VLEIGGASASSSSGAGADERPKEDGKQGQMVVAGWPRGCRGIRCRQGRSAGDSTLAVMLSPVRHHLSILSLLTATGSSSSFVAAAANSESLPPPLAASLLLHLMMHARTRPHARQRLDHELLVDTAADDWNTSSLQGGPPQTPHLRRGRHPLLSPPALWLAAASAGGAHHRGHPDLEADHGESSPSLGSSRNGDGEPIGLRRRRAAAGQPTPHNLHRCLTRRRRGRHRRAG
jgi:hypothetical protein